MRRPAKIGGASAAQVTPMDPGEHPQPNIPDEYVRQDEIAGLIRGGEFDDAIVRRIVEGDDGMWAYMDPSYNADDFKDKVRQHISAGHFDDAVFDRIAEVRPSESDHTPRELWDLYYDMIQGMILEGSFDDVVEERYTEKFDIGPPGGL